jgi:hypothetical protein
MHERGNIQELRARILDLQNLFHELPSGMRVGDVEEDLQMAIKVGFCREAARTLPHPSFSRQLWMRGALSNWRPSQSPRLWWTTTWTTCISCIPVYAHILGQAVNQPVISCRHYAAPKPSAQRRRVEDIMSIMWVLRNVTPLACACRCHVRSSRACILTASRDEASIHHRGA